MSKKILNVFLIFTILIGIMPAVGFGAQTLASGFCGDSLTWTVDKNGVLIIDGSGNMYDWTNYANVPWADYRSKITSVVMGDNVTNIGNYAFMYCSVLRSIKISNAVEKIGDYAFSSCNGISSITIPDRVESIGKYAFSSCDGLTNITIPNRVKSIGDYTFSDSDGLTNIIIGNGVKSIGKYAFSSCDGLINITIPNSVESIGDNAFYCCERLSEIEVDSDNVNYSSEDAILFNKNKTTLICYPAGNSQTSYTIPSSIENIGPYAFAYSDLDSIALPNGLENIGPYAFYQSNLSNITIPYSMEIIGPYAFAYANVSSITIPTSVKTIAYGAFGFCPKLTQVHYNGSVEDWNKIAIVSDNDYLTNAEIICITAKGSCGTNLKWTLYSNGLISIDGSGAMNNWASAAHTPWYSYRNSITSVLIGDNVESIGKYAFYYCPKLSNVIIGNSVVIIEWGAFSNCDSLNSITIPDNVKIIGEHGFSYCDAITAITVPNSVESIGNHAFMYCKNLRNITIANSVGSIGARAFSYCDSLTDVYYIGTQEDWGKIEINSDNEVLANVNIHYMKKADGGIDFDISFEGDTSVGTVYTAMYNIDGSIKCLKQYTISDDVEVVFEAAEVGVELKVMWWDENNSPICDMKVFLLK